MNSIMVSMKNYRTAFSQKVWEVVCVIPKGKVMTYAMVAKLAGFPGAARAVGTLMSKNFDLKRPCHRVVRSDGQIGQYNRGEKKKLELLRKEGVVIEQGRVVL